MIALAQEALPRGGRLSVDISRGEAGLDCVVTASGQDAHLRPESLAGLQDSVDLEELSPRGVQGYFTRLMAQRLGSDLVVEGPVDGSLQFRVTLPA